MYIGRHIQVYVLTYSWDKQEEILDLEVVQQFEPAGFSLEQCTLHIFLPLAQKDKLYSTNLRMSCAQVMWKTSHWQSFVAMRTVGNITVAAAGSFNNRLCNLLYLGSFSPLSFSHLPRRHHLLCNLFQLTHLGLLQKLVLNLENVVHVINHLLDACHYLVWVNIRMCCLMSRLFSETPQNWQGLSSACLNSKLYLMKCDNWQQP